MEKTVQKQNESLNSLLHKMESFMDRKSTREVTISKLFEEILMKFHEFAIKFDTTYRDVFYGSSYGSSDYAYSNILSRIGWKLFAELMLTFMSPQREYLEKVTGGTSSYNNQSSYQSLYQSSNYSLKMDLFCRETMQYKIVFGPNGIWEADQLKPQNFKEIASLQTPSGYMEHFHLLSF